MTLPVQAVGGSAQVLVAQVPKAGGRWHQVHFNMKVASQFFRLEAGTQRRISIERVDSAGRLHEAIARPLVLSEVNKNSKIEFDFGSVREYPASGVPILLVLELDVRTFRYQLLVPGDGGYDEMLQLNHELPAVGRGLPRGITTLDEVELRWPGCRLRAPRRA